MEKLSIFSFKNDSSFQKMLHESSLFFATSGVTFLITSSPIKYDVIMHPKVLFSKCVLMKNQNRNETFLLRVDDDQSFMKRFDWSKYFNGSNLSRNQLPPISHRHRFPPIEISLPPLIFLKKNDELEKIMNFKLGTPCRENFWQFFCYVCPPIKIIGNGQVNQTNPTPF